MNPEMLSAHTRRWRSVCFYILYCSAPVSAVMLGGRTSLHAENVFYHMVVPFLAQHDPVLVSSYPTGINQSGEVCGTFFVRGDLNLGEPPFLYTPFVYSDSVGIVELIDRREGLQGFATGINDRGQVAIFGGRVDGDVGVAYRFTPGVGLETLDSVGKVGGDFTHGINNLGQVVGVSDLPDALGSIGFFAATPDNVIGLGSFDPQVSSSARDINDSGQITGVSDGRAFIYTSELGMIPIGRGVGFAINKNGVVAGASDGAALFKGGNTLELGSFGGDSWANDLNDYNVVVGAAYHSWFFPTASSGFVWSEATGLLNLNSFLPTGWSVGEARGVNNRGQIVCQGYSDGTGETPEGAYVVRLDPIVPRLAVQSVNGKLKVSWSPAWPGLVLESTADLVTADWQPVSTGGTNVIHRPFTAPSQFFRLNLESIRGLCCAPE